MYADSSRGQSRACVAVLPKGEACQDLAPAESGPTVGHSAQCSPHTRAPNSHRAQGLRPRLPDRTDGRVRVKESGRGVMMEQETTIRENMRLYLLGLVSEEDQKRVEQGILTDSSAY